MDDFSLSDAAANFLTIVLVAAFLFWPIPVVAYTTWTVLTEAIMISLWVVVLVAILWSMEQEDERWRRGWR